MCAVGIIAEYNPFHNGHLYQLRAARAAAGDAGIVVALSGDFVQRGEAAVFSKFARAEAAVRCGASLVLELPLPWCLSSAEGFARGAVGLLAATGVTDALSFGSECGDLARLRAAAAALDAPEFPAALRRELAAGAPFAAARERAAASLLGAEAAGVLRTPNDLLAVEYIRAAGRLGAGLALQAVRRSGGDHDGPGSASALREILGRGGDIAGSVPAEALGVFQRETEAGRGPVGEEDLRLPLLSRLRALPDAAFSRLPDAAEGVENLLRAAARTELSPAEIAMAAKSKRYALARLRRMTLCAALGVERGMADGTPPYLRVLAMDTRGRALLREMREKAALPAVVRPARLRGDRERALFALGSRAHDLYALGYACRRAQRGGEDWRAAPFLLAGDD